jgi:mutator protein MutT
VIEREDRFLVRRRPPGGHLAGLWEFPGGKLEAAESWEDALKRETLEELGVAAIACALLEERTFEYPERTVRLRFYRAVLEGGAEPRAVEEGAPLKWVTADELLALPVPDANRDVIARLVAPLGGAGAHETPLGRGLTVAAWAALGLPAAFVLAGMIVLAADNGARLLGTDLAHLGAAGPAHLLAPHRAIFLVGLVIIEAVFVALGLQRASRG